VQDQWAKGEAGPDAYFQKINLDNCRIAIDEIHTFLGQSTPKGVVQEWRLFLGTLRHRGCEFECLTQNESKVHKAIKDEAGLKRSLFNSENKPDPFFGIRMEDWYELRAKLTGRYLPWIYETVFTEVHGKWRETAALGGLYPLRPDLFPLYNSYSTPHQGGNASKGRQHPYQTLSTVGLLLWFLRRNWFRISTRLIVVVFVLWLCFGGGMSSSINGFIGLMKHMKPPDQSSAPSAAPSISKSPNGGNDEVKDAVKTDAPSADVPSEDPRDLEITKLRSVIADRDKEIDSLKTDAARFAEIVSLFGDQVTLRSGITVDKGEQIPIGPLKGRTIKGINHAKRRVLLDDGTVLPLAP
jgi:hypothetical protein